MEVPHPAIPRRSQIIRENLSTYLIVHAAAEEEEVVGGVEVFCEAFRTWTYGTVPLQFGGGDDGPDPELSGAAAAPRGTDLKNNL